MAFVNAMFEGSTGRDRPGAVPMSEEQEQHKRAGLTPATKVNPAIWNVTRSLSPNRRRLANSRNSGTAPDGDDYEDYGANNQSSNPSASNGVSSSHYLRPVGAAAAAADPTSFQPIRASRAEQRRKHVAPFAAPAPASATTGGSSSSSSNRTDHHNNTDDKQERWQKDHFGDLTQARWVQQCPSFGEEKRYRPSETWNAISPNFAPLDKVFPNAWANHVAAATRSGTTDTTLSSEDWNIRSLSEAIAASGSRSTSPTNNTTATGGGGGGGPAGAGTTTGLNTRTGSVITAVDPRDPKGYLSNDNPFTTASPSRKNKQHHHHHQPDAVGGRSPRGVGVDDDDDDDLVDDSWSKNKLLALGSTNNPNSQRLFSKLAHARFEKDREQMSADALKGIATVFDKKAQRRSANNLLPPTPFSQTVDVIPGPLPHWTRRLEPARDLEAGGNSDEDSDDEPTHNIFDDFLLGEIERAKNEKPRTEKRGDFYRLPLQPSEKFLKIYDHPPQSDKDPNQAALEYLMVNRPEFAPALRRLTQHQLDLIDWTSLFRGGTHQDVSVTAKPFPHGAAWATSPFSEAPVESGSLGFVGNLGKREREMAFFTKLHSSQDGRVDDFEMMKWVKEKAQIRYTPSEQNAL